MMLYNHIRAIVISAIVPFDSPGHEYPRGLDPLQSAAARLPLVLVPRSSPILARAGHFPGRNSSAQSAAAFQPFFLRVLRASVVNNLPLATSYFRNVATPFFP